jgi:hypothetical protein
MKAEKVILSFIAIIVGLAAAGIAFYLYQMTRTVPDQKAKPISVAKKVVPTPVPDSTNLFTVDSPADEEVFDKKTITVHGKSVKGATIIVTSEENDQVVKTAENGDFSLSQTIPDGTSLLELTAIFPNGSERKITKTVTFTTETF